MINRQILLVSRPPAEPTADNFALVERALPALEEGQVLVRHHYLSLDPYMRGRMSDARSYAAPHALDTVMLGGTAGEVVESRDPSLAPGDRVVGFGGWQEHSIASARALQKVDTTHVPLSAYLGPVGMPGITAWYGVEKILHTRPGQTVVVSAAAGAVGSVVGQLAKVRGARVVGIAGGLEKCRVVVDELGFDACLDYKAHQDARALGVALEAACPAGIDGHFENVGGIILDAVLGRMNAFGRIAMCGMIAGYSGTPIPMASPQLILTNRLTVEGFIVSEHLDVWPTALRELGGLVAAGTLKYRETIADGLAAAPEAFIGLLEGKNLGKQLVKLV